MATLTRQELYDLVWLHPRTELAARLGVSDVAIGKACVRAKIPAPPRGYWARIGSGRGQRISPLPTRMPGQPNTVYVGASTATVESAAGGPSVRPAFVEDVDAQVAAALAAIPKGWLRGQLSTPHKALSRVLASEERRRLSADKTGWPVFGPRLADPDHQRQLTIFNRLSHALGAVWNYTEVRVDDEWRQGKGTIYHLSLHCGFNVSSVTFTFLDPRDRHREYRNDSNGPATLYFTADQAGQYDAKWEDAPGLRLEAQLHQVVETAFRNEELAQREWQRIRFQEAIERMEAAEKARVAAELERQRRAAEQAAAAEQARRDDLTVEAARWHQASQIRAYIAHLHASGSTDTEWQTWAMRVADELDPTEERMTMDRKAKNNARG